MDRDLQIRLAAFAWLEAQTNIFGDTLPRTLLEEGFRYEGERVPMVGPQGIWKPKLLDVIPISITTTPKGPYQDYFGPDGYLRYAYRGQDPNHRDNVGLRAARTHHVPLVYFHGVMPGKYLAEWPVFLERDDPGSLRFFVSVDDRAYFTRQVATTGSIAGLDDENGPGRRRYITAQYRVRLHQTAFRERVLDAYRDQCALCRLKHRELLDAAHIIPDAEPEGDPDVKNGLALCKLHHAAFDRFFLTVTPEYRIEIRPDILKERDGPMLLHGLKELHGQRIITPKSRSWLPDPARLEARYQQFRTAATPSAAVPKLEQSLH
jgi:putative restriction endonuclease